MSSRKASCNTSSHQDDVDYLQAARATSHGSLWSNYCKHEFSATYTPQQNGVVERKNKTLITLARAMLDDYSTSEKFWAEAINTACHASNRVYLHRLL